MKANKKAFPELSGQEREDNANIVWREARSKRKGQNGKKDFVFLIEKLIKGLDIIAKTKVKEVSINFLEFCFSFIIFLPFQGIDLNDLHKKFLGAYKTAFSKLSVRECQDNANAIWHEAKLKYRCEKDLVCFIEKHINELKNTGQLNELDDAENNKIEVVC